MKPIIRRCALYTRKSSEEGLEQGFNSLDAQREACAAYVKSQVGEGWRVVDKQYDDGGYSGGSMGRPALKRLLADIETGRVDVVVVYKIDRLTRALADFARMVELFDRHNVSFVSVTQAFNTTSSMGRLTLNVLLSFAQFEREVTGERIRDKIAASKAKGMWMGGTPPLGYDLPVEGSRALIVNAAEAETVRAIFAAYIELRSVHALERHLKARGILSKQRNTAKGRITGGKPFSRGALFHLLRNRTYLGMIVHKSAVHPGMHQAIVDADTFETVRQHLDANVRRHTSGSNRVARAPLTGRVFDADGHPMSPSFSHGKGGKVYRYYVAAPLQQGRPAQLSDDTIRRVPASDLESRLAEIIARTTTPRTSDPLSRLTRVEVHPNALHMLMPLAHLNAMRERLAEGEQVMPDANDPSQLRLVVPISMRRGRGWTWITSGATPPTRPDPTLIKALRTAQKLVEFDSTGLPVLMAAPQSAYLRRLVRLAFLAPDLQRAVLAGRQPRGLCLEQLLAAPLPLSWKAQASGFAIRPGG